MLKLAVHSQLLTQLDELDIRGTCVLISDVEHAALFGEVALPQLLIDHFVYEQAKTNWCTAVAKRLRQQAELGSCETLPSDPNAMRRITSLITRALCSPSGLQPWPVTHSLSFRFVAAFVCHRRHRSLSLGRASLS